MLSSSRPNDQSGEPTYKLERKLGKLEEMLTLTRELRSQPVQSDARRVERFNQELNRLLADLKRIDEQPDDTPPQAVPELQKRIQDTLAAIMELNQSLQASVQAERQMVGDEIGSLKKKKDVLKTYQPPEDPDSSIIDTDL